MLLRARAISSTTGGTASRTKRKAVAASWGRFKRRPDFVADAAASAPARACVGNQPNSLIYPYTIGLPALGYGPPRTFGPPRLSALGRLSPQILPPVSASTDIAIAPA